MVGAWESQCGKLDQYGMQHTRAFANLCNAGVAPVSLRAQVRVVLDQIQHLDMQLRFKYSAGWLANFVQLPDGVVTPFSCASRRLPPATRSQWPVPNSTRSGGGHGTHCCQIFQHATSVEGERSVDVLPGVSATVLRGWNVRYHQGRQPLYIHPSCGQGSSSCSV